MNRTLSASALLRPWAVAAVLAILVACGGEAPAPPTPPPPAPFQPQVVVLDLGSHGGKTTLVSTQAGGWTLNGEPFTSGSTITGEGERTYELTFSNNRWSAEFVAPDPASVALGGSGDSVAVQVQEDGTYRVGDEPLASDDVREAANGNRYRFTLGASGTWTAAYVAPDPVPVALGNSGDSAELVRQEDGTYSYAGMVLADGVIRTATNGNRYRFQVRNGDWTAEYVAPSPARVALGTSGSVVLVEVNEDGTYSINGNMFRSGETYRAANGNQYRLEIESGGTWTVEFVPPAPTAVALGASGNIVLIDRLENGMYSLEGELLLPNQERTSADGSTYRFNLGPTGLWTATFVSGATLTVDLGNSGNTVMITRLENRRFELDGRPLTSGQIITFPNGSRYRFDLQVDGNWRAVYVQEQVLVRLGSLGGSTLLVREENGTFTRNGVPFASDTVLDGVNGRGYRLTLGPGGWVAELVPIEVAVSVTASDVSIVLLQEENGEFSHEGMRVGNGSTIDVGNSTYELRFSNGRWTAIFSGGEIEIALGTRGDSITIVQLPNGTYEYEGRRIRNASVVTSPDTGIRYRLRLEDGVWTSSIYSLPTTGGGSGGGSTGGGTTTPTRTLENLEEALPDGFIRANDGTLIQRTAINLVKSGQADVADTDYARYRGSGSVERGTFVEAARNVIESAVEELNRLVEGTDSEAFVARVVIADRWPKIRDALAKVFNDGAQLLPVLPSTTDSIDEERRLDDLEDLLEAMSDVETFKSEVVSAFGEFSGLGITDSAIAEKIFNATKGAFAFGTTDNTRFGVIAEPENAMSAEAIAGGSSSDLDVRAFAYSPLAPTLTTSLPSRGTARYRGRTFAAEVDGDMFSGTIELWASLGIEYIRAEVTDLRNSSDGSDWTYLGKSVEKITLPEIEQGELDDQGRFTAVGSPTAMIQYEGVDSLFPESASAEFVGQFVGPSDDPGDEIFGTWALRDSGNDILLDGSFGAEHQSTARTVLPASDNDGLSEEYTDSALNSGATLDVAGNSFTINALSSEPFTILQLYRSSSTVSKSSAPHTGRVRFRHTDYTRFAAWAHTDDGTLSDTGAFGYATLAVASYSGAGDDNYPRNVTARYDGLTVAVDDEGALFDGNLQLTVDWNDNSVGGEVVTVISSLRNTSGRASFRVNGLDVVRIGFRGTFSGISFSVTGANIQFTAGGTPVERTGSQSGSFLGEGGTDGPFAVLGNWNLTQDGSTIIQGEFGADLEPAP